ncbi:MAG: Gldg family protein [Oceanospirillaceae bacterium]|nr:Gldg family protein [Oceanospirillaceae bacterium]MCP5349781.1 Gldg family protein [Oceanospirillaceae bacterium]
MQRYFQLPLAALLAAILLVISGFAFKHLRLDLTEQQVFTLSDGSRHIVSGLQNKVELTLYYSDKASKDLIPLRNYAQQVKDLLAEYVMAGNGNITLKIVDPEPFSEAEDKAAESGLQAVPVASGEDIYFGLVAKSVSGEEAVIGFLQPDKEAFLEYDISELIYRMGRAKAPAIGLLSSLDVRGGFDMQTGQPTTPWVVFEQMEQLYEVRSLDDQLSNLDPDINLLILIQPPQLSEEALYRLDQYVLKGGKLLLFVDPKAEQASMPELGNAELDTSLQPLFAKWGIEYDASKVVLDAAYGLTVSTQQGALRHLGLLGTSHETINANEVSTEDLESINFASTGFIKPLENATTNFDDLVWSSNYAMPLDVNAYNLVHNPAELANEFKTTGDFYSFAGRISGPVDSAFNNSQLAQQNKDHIQHADINVVVVADTDVLSDRMWVQVQSFFGRRSATPWADNGSFVNNLIEQFMGSADLISIRSRGRFNRPFTVVQDLQRQAADKLQENEMRLEQRLKDTEAQLAELEAKKHQSSEMMTSEQEAALLDFQKEKLEIRKELREVRHALDKDIEALGARLKVLNILVLPVLLTLLLLLIARRFIKVRK